jgi:hypothetical protein
MLLMKSTIGFQQLVRACCRAQAVGDRRAMLTDRPLGRPGAAQDQLPDMGSQSERRLAPSAGNEQRGVGWLWQVDAENRVVYISAGWAR